MSKEANLKNQKKLKLYLTKNGTNIKPDKKTDRRLREKPSPN